MFCFPCSLKSNCLVWAAATETLSQLLYSYPEWCVVGTLLCQRSFIILWAKEETSWKEEKVIFMPAQVGMALYCTCFVWAWLLRTRPALCPHRSVHCIKQNVWLKWKMNLCLSCEVMKFRADCCVWSRPAVCLLRLGEFASESAWVLQVSYSEGRPDSAGLCTPLGMLAQVRRAALILGSAESLTGHSRAVITELKAALRKICFSP